MADEPPKTKPSTVKKTKRSASVGDIGKQIRKAQKEIRVYEAAIEGWQEHEREWQRMLRQREQRLITINGYCRAVLGRMDNLRTANTIIGAHYQELTIRDAHKSRNVLSRVRYIQMLRERMAASGVPYPLREPAEARVNQVFGNPETVEGQSLSARDCTSSQCSLRIAISDPANMNILTAFQALARVQMEEDEQIVVD